MCRPLYSNVMTIEDNNNNDIIFDQELYSDANMDMEMNDDVSHSSHQASQSHSHSHSHSHSCHQPKNQMVRSSSPTSTLQDLEDESEPASTPNYDCIDVECAHTTSASASTSTLHRSVSWREEIVTDVMYRPKTNSSEKKELYYNSTDMQRFRQHYKMQIRAAQQYQKRLRQEKKEQLESSHVSQVESESESEQQQEQEQEQPCREDNASTGTCLLQPKHFQSGSQQHQHHLYTSPITGLINMMTSYMAKSSSSSTDSSSSSSSSTGPIAETCVLVDTLYLF